MKEEWVIVHTAAFPRPRYNHVQEARDYATDSIVVRISAQQIVEGRNDYRHYSNVIDGFISDTLNRIEMKNEQSLEGACDRLLESLL